MVFRHQIWALGALIAAMESSPLCSFIHVNHEFTPIFLIYTYNYNVGSYQQCLWFSIVSFLLKLKNLLSNNIHIITCSSYNIANIVYVCLYYH